MDGTSESSTAGTGSMPPPYAKKVSEPPPYTPKAGPVTCDPLCEKDTVLLRQRLGDGGWSLLEANLRTTDFSWFVEMTGAWPRDGKPVAGGLLIATMDGRLFYCRYKADGGLSIFADFTSVCVVAPKADCAFSAEEVGGSYELLVSFPEYCSIESANLVLDKRGVVFSGGNWFDVWRGACAQRLGVSGDSVSLAEVSVLEPRLDDFGVKTAASHRATLLTFKDSSVVALPQVDLGVTCPDAWWSGGQKLEILAGGGVPRCVELSLVSGSRPAATLSRLMQLLPSDKMSPKPLAGRLVPLGYFQCKGQPGEKGRRLLLERSETAVIAHDDPVRTFRRGARLGEAVVLVTDDGECAAVEVRGPARDSFLLSVKEIEGLIPISGAESGWTLALRDDGAMTPVRVVVSADAVEIVGVAVVAYSAAGEASIGAHRPDGLRELSLSWRDGETERRERLLLPETAAFRIWEEWEVGRTRHKASCMGFTDLYRSYNAARRHEFLLSMYGEMLLLDRTLQSGVSMPALVRKLSEMGAVRFAEDKDLRDQTIAKTVVMLDVINQMKQKAEVFATLYPYYWVRSESEWLAEVFGAEAAKAPIAAESRRLVPLVRRQIRSVQAEIMRPLLQIEAAARPIETLLGREEVRRHWSTKARTLLPGAVQAGIGVAMMLAGGAAGITFVASAIGVQGLGTILDRFQRDKEGAAQLMRAAETIFPWWEVLMATMPVSIHESGQFMDDECVRSMKRDRAIADSLVPGRCAEAKARLRGMLMSTILDNRRKAFRELAQGSGVRITDLMDDLRKATAVTFKQSVDTFVAEMTMGLGDRQGTEAGND